MAGKEKALVIFLHSSRYDRVYQALSMLLAASSMGWPCYLFLFFEALGSYMGGKWDEVNLIPGDEGDNESASFEFSLLKKMQKGFELSNFPSLYEMLASARRGKAALKLCACSASVRLLGLEPEKVREKVDEIVGLPTMLQIAREADHSLYI